MKITPVEPPCKLGWLDVRLPDEAIDKLNNYISKASKMLKYNPSHNISEGIEATVSWYLKNER